MLEIFNTMTRKKETFKPMEDMAVKIFTCGPSIYRRPHVGNYRSFLWEDVLQRYLEYLGYQVNRVINFTDIEDKAMAEARQKGESVLMLTGHVSEQFFKDTRLLRIKLPPFIPRSSTSVDTAAELIQILLDKGYAYWHEGNVFFDPLKFNGFGKLFRLDMSNWPKTKKRFKKDTYPGRRWNLGDFILWHGYKPGDDVFWETPIGKGRPSWNIQDPAMIVKHLGYQVDISCGGIDNLYRHHDYNIAVIESVSGVEFARYWVHGEHLLADGKKMSKSQGNIIYPEDILKEGYSAEHIRFYLLYGHHRKRMNLTGKGMKEATRKLGGLREIVSSLAYGNSGSSGTDTAAAGLIDSLPGAFEKYMNDDLNIKGAIDALLDAISRLKLLKKGRGLNAEETEKLERKLRKIDDVLQVIFPLQDGGNHS